MATKAQTASSSRDHSLRNNKCHDKLIDRDSMTSSSFVRHRYRLYHQVKHL